MHRGGPNTDVGAEVGVPHEGGDSDAELATGVEVAATLMWELRRAHRMPEAVETRS